MSKGKLADGKRGSGWSVRKKNGEKWGETTEWSGDYRVETADKNGAGMYEDLEMVTPECCREGMSGNSAAGKLEYIYVQQDSM